MGLIAGLWLLILNFLPNMSSSCMVPGVRWLVNFFMLHLKEKKVMSNSPCIPLGGAGAWETTWLCYDCSQRPIAMKWDTWGVALWYSDWGHQNINKGLQCFCHKHHVLNTYNHGHSMLHQDRFIFIDNILDFATKGYVIDLYDLKRNWIQISHNWEVADKLFKYFRGHSVALKWDLQPN